MQPDWEQDNTKIFYPFDIYADPALRALFADALIVDRSTKASMPVRLTALSVDAGNLPAATTTLLYADSTTFFTGTVTAATEFGSWITLRFVSPAYDREAVLLLSKKALATPVVGSYNSFFASRVLDFPDKRVSSIEVTDMDNVTHVFTEPVELVAGYNMELAVDGSRVAMSAIAGAGAGLVPSDCEPDGLLRTINGAGPDTAGNVDILLKDCYRCAIPYIDYGMTSVTFSPYTLQLINDCYSCCDCEDYDRVYNGMNRLYNRGKNIGNRFRSILGGPTLPEPGYNELRNDMEDERRKREIPSMLLFLRPSTGFVMGVQVVFRNNRAGVALNLAQMDAELRVEKSPDDMSPFNPLKGKIIPESLYVLNSSRNTQWERRTVDQVFPDYVDLEAANQPVIMNITRLDDNDDPVDEVVVGTEYVVVFFELYFSATALPENDVPVAVSIECGLFAPDTVAEEEKLVASFEGV